MLTTIRILIFGTLFSLVQPAQSQTVQGVKLACNIRSFFPNTIGLSADIKVKKLTFITGLSYAAKRSSFFSPFFFKNNFRLGGTIGIVILQSAITPKFNYRLSVTEDFFFPHFRDVYEPTGLIISEEKITAHFLAINQQLSFKVNRFLSLFYEAGVGDFFWFHKEGYKGEKMPSFSFAIGLTKTFSRRQDSQQ